MRLESGTLLSAATVAASQTSSSENLDNFYMADLIAVITAANPADKTFVPGDVAGSTVTIAAHGYTTGVKVTLTTTVALPTPLAALTDYYLIVLTANTLQFATSQANALAGTPITLTDAGTGVQTIVVNTTIAGTILLQKNDDQQLSLAPSTVPTWVDIGTGAAGFSVAGSSSQSFAAAGNLSWKLADIGFRNIRAVVTVTSGTVLVTLKFAAKGF